MKISLPWILQLYLVLTMSTTQGNSSNVIHLEYEVHGEVQGVFFRKYTKTKATQLELKGWVMNTRHGTVKGVAEGSRAAVDEMKTWLSKTGSPSSRIIRCDFDEKSVPNYSFTDFRIVNK